MLPNWFLLASGYPDSEVKYGKRFLESDLTESSICVDTDGLTAIRHERVDKPLHRIFRRFQFDS